MKSPLCGLSTDEKSFLSGIFGLWDQSVDGPTRWWLAQVCGIGVARGCKWHRRAEHTTESACCTLPLRNVLHHCAERDRRPLLGWEQPRKRLAALSPSTYPSYPSIQFRDVAGRVILAGQQINLCCSTCSGFKMALLPQENAFSLRW